MIIAVKSCFLFQHSKHTQHVVRSSCLNLIGAVGSQDTISKDTDQSEEHVSVQTLLISFTQDQDPRVRSSAFRAVVYYINFYTLLF